MEVDIEPRAGAKHPRTETEAPNATSIESRLSNAPIIAKTLPITSDNITNNTELIFRD